MKKQRGFIPILILVIVVLVAASAYFLGTKKGSVNSIVGVPTAVLTESPNKNEGWKDYKFDEIGLSFSAPNDLQVTSDPQRSAETNNLYSYLFYIQKGMAGKSDYYQLYGIYQFGSQYEKSTTNDFKEDLNPTSIEETTVGGFPALKGQIKGQRNRFVTYIITNKGLLALFTAEPTQVNKELTDQILLTFKFTK